MSLLLDALRKSEKRRRGGAPPPLGLPAGPGAGAPSGGGDRPRRRLGLVLVIVVGVLAIALSAWWGAGRPGQEHLEAWLPSPLGEPVETDRGGTDVDATERQLVADTYRRPEDGGIDEAEPDPAPRVEPDSSTSEPADDRPGDRTVPAADNSVTPRPTGEAEVARTSRIPAEETPAERLGREVQPTPPAQDEMVDDDSANRSPDPAQVAEAVDSRPVQPGRPETVLPRPEPVEAEARDDTITPWELPSAVRAEFPSIDVAVHFYASEASNRFVLIEGERYTEGDEIASGVELTEIRRSGIVVEFRAYRVRIE